MKVEDLTLQPQVTMSNVLANASPHQKLNSNILEVIVDNQPEDNNQDMLQLEDPIDYNNNDAIMSDNTMG